MKMHKIAPFILLAIPLITYAAGGTDPISGDNAANAGEKINLSANGDYSGLCSNTVSIYVSGNCSMPGSPVTGSSGCSNPTVSGEMTMGTGLTQCVVQYGWETKSGTFGNNANTPASIKKTVYVKVNQKVQVLSSPRSGAMQKTGDKVEAKTYTTDYATETNTKIIYESATPSVCTINAAGENIVYVSPGECRIILKSTNTDIATNQVNNNLSTNVHTTFTGWDVYPEPDADGDGINDFNDNCPADANPGQEDMDGDGIGDVCDNDRDGDGFDNGDDNCPGTPNPDQTDSNGIGIGDVCYVAGGDVDEDGVTDVNDNCPTVANPDQKDTDSNGVGDACDSDIDGDGVANDSDNCVYVVNPDQLDSSANGIGDACERKFVSLSGNDNNNCNSWQNACKSIQKGIDAAAAEGLPQVFIKEGVYRPTTTINLKRGVSLVGGFKGSELQSAQADPLVNLTIISGDVNGNDAANSDGLVEQIDVSNNGDNIGPLVRANNIGANLNETIALQGLIFNAANNAGNGGALDIVSSRLRIMNSRFVANKAQNGGAVWLRNNGKLELVGNQLSNNQATAKGGALYVLNNGASLESKSNKFTGNTAQKGGALAAGSLGRIVSDVDIYLTNTAQEGAALFAEGTANVAIESAEVKENQASIAGGGLFLKDTVFAKVSKTQFIKNQATNDGGGANIASQGTVELLQNYWLDNQANAGGALAIASGSAKVNNSTFLNNKALAGHGGAIYSSAATSPTYQHLTLYGNTATGDGGAIYSAGGSATLNASIVAGNNATNGANVSGSISDAGFNVLGFNGDAGVVGMGLAPTSVEPTAEQATTVDQIIELIPDPTKGDGYYSSMPTLAVKGNSVARNLIPKSDCDLAIDARGEDRPDSKNEMCDAGAYEFTVLTCEEDARRRYQQGELFVKSCQEGLEDFELSLGKMGYLSLVLLLALAAARRRVNAG